jgi:hypothetical protein
MRLLARYRVVLIALTPTLLTWTIWRAPTNASKWRMGFNSAFKGLNWLRIKTSHQAFMIRIIRFWFALREAEFIDWAPAWGLLNRVFWVLRTRNLLEIFRCFGDSYRLHLQVGIPWTCERYVLHKLLYVSTGVQDLKSQKKAALSRHRHENINSRMAKLVMVVMEVEWRCYSM